MRIVLDGRMWRWTGIGTYIQVLLEGLREVRLAHEISILVHPDDMPEFPVPEASDENLRLVPCRVPVYAPREMWGLARTLRSLRFDLVHFPHYIYPYWKRLPAVVTIHDLIHLRFPFYHKTPAHYAFARHVLPRSARAARRVITISHHSKADIVSRLGVPPEKVTVIHSGLSRLFASLPEDAGGASDLYERAAARVKRELGLSAPYVLYVGNAKKHKNLHTLVAAYRRLAQRPLWENRAGPPALALTCRREDLRGKAARADVEGVRFLGRVSGDMLIDLYRAAGVFAFPSLYEGFGYPPLEAMACGTPVVCSDAASLPEVVGDAAVQVDPDDLDRLSSALYDLLTKEDLRIRLRMKGLSRARSFRARAMAEATLRVYEEVHSHG